MAKEIALRNGLFPTLPRAIAVNVPSTVSRRLKKLSSVPKKLEMPQSSAAPAISSTIRSGLRWRKVNWL